MSTQPTPKYHWTFAEIGDSVTNDTVSNATAQLSSVVQSGQGRIGNAIALNGSDSSYISLGREIGQFGRSDFTVAFGVKIARDTRASELLGNQTTDSHGNFFTIRFSPEQRILVEIDEDGNETNYIPLSSNPGLNDDTWHHVAVVRQQNELKLYIDGNLSDRNSANGVANIANGNELRTGKANPSFLASPKAKFEDLRIYDCALSSQQVSTLVPPLKEGEFELITQDGIARKWMESVSDITPVSDSFQGLRLGPNTSAILGDHKLYDKGGNLYKAVADLPDLSQTKIGTAVKHVSIYTLRPRDSSNGKWAFLAPNNQYVSSLGIADRGEISFDFIGAKTVPNVSYDNNTLFNYIASSRNALKEIEEGDFHLFSLCYGTPPQWVTLNDDNELVDTLDKEKRAIFTRAVQIFEDEWSVEELLPGEVALYEHPGYWGRTWVLYSGCSDFAGIEGLNDKISSIRLGPQTGATLYTDADYTTSPDREKVADIVENIPDLSKTQIGSDTLSSIKTWGSISPEQADIAVSSTLSQDYRLVGETLHEFSSYRTIIKFLPKVKEVEVWATDLTEIEVDGTTHRVSEDISVKLAPNAMNRLMITSEAEGITTPGLKIRTNTMHPHERIVIFPDQEAHEKLAQLDDNALWDARIPEEDSNNPGQPKADPENPGQLLLKPLVDQHVYSRESVAAVQQTIANTMTTVKYSADESRPCCREIHAASMHDCCCVLTFEGNDVSHQDISQDEFAQHVVQASAPGAHGWKDILKELKQAISTAASVVVGAVKNVMSVIVKKAGEAVDAARHWVIHTAEMAGAFVEGLVSRVGISAKQFVESVRSVFDWQDILSTQKYLADSFKTGLRYVETLANAAKEPVHNFMTGLKQSVTEGIDQSIERLKQNTSSVDSQPELPHQLEWLLSKLSGNSSALHTETSNKVSKPPSNGADFFSSLTTESKSVVDGMLEGLEALGVAIAMLIAQPTHPQLALCKILEMAKNVTNAFLEAIDKLSEKFFDAIINATQKFQELITAEINIPFFTALLKKLLRISQLNLLNIFSLLLAIPVTVTSKLIFGKNLSPELPPITLSSRQIESQAFAIIGYIADAINGVITAGLDNTYLENISFEVGSLILSFFSWLASFPDSSDFDGGRPYDIVTYHITDPEHPVPRVESEYYWGRVMWGWRTAVLGIDVLAIVVMRTRLKRGFKKNPTNLGEFVEKTMPILCILFAIVDFGITAKYMSVVKKDILSKPGGEKTWDENSWSEMLGIWPSIFAFLGYGDQVAKGALGIFDLLSAGVVAGLQGDILRREFSELGRS
jgi:Concanavalin A-like lectin/glucanases superfamily